MVNASAAWAVYVEDSAYETIIGNDIGGAGSMGVSLVRSSYNVVNDNNIAANGDSGIYLYWSDFNSIQGNNITQNQMGIRLWFSANNNKISANRITNNTSYGMYLYGWNTGTTNDNSIRGNIITDNNHGLDLYYSHYNTIIENDIVENAYGMYLHGSSNNDIYHNNLLNNTNQAYLWTSVNFYWDNGCEGNYWSNYNGTDSDGDGAGDTPYTINIDNIDRYPLMNRYWIPADVNHDLIVNIFDVVKITGAYGATPASPYWNPHADIAQPFDKIDILDVVTCTGHYGEKYP